jgi:hypothetical protein
VVFPCAVSQRKPVPDVDVDLLLEQLIRAIAKNRTKKITSQRHFIRVVLRSFEQSFAARLPSFVYQE